ncbi:MAG: MFS transporter [Pseudonocardiales bacterium]
MAVSDSAPPRPRAPGLWAGPRFRLFWMARTVSVAGTTMTAVALPVLVFRLSGSPLLTALVAALEATAYVGVGLLAGAMADRVDPRQLMIGCDLLCAVTLLSVPAAALAGTLSTVHVLAAAAVLALAFVWFDAASFAMLPALVGGKDRLAAANGALWTASSVLETAAPALAGLLIALSGPQLLLAVDAGTYLVSVLLLARLRWTERPAGQRGIRSLGADISVGLRFLWQHPALRALSLLGLGNSIAGGAVVGLLVVFAVQALGLPPTDARIGILFSAGAAGGMLAAVLLGRLSRRIPGGRLTLLSLTANPVLLIGFASAVTPVPAMIAYSTWSFAWTVTILNGITLRQQVTPAPLQARVNTAGRIIAWGGTPIGAVLGGVLAEFIGVRIALFAAAAVVGVSAAAGWGTPLAAREVGW